ncbi:hypothetical protein H6F96_01055 [Microcoleus sp. FACHB-53]|jgi:hypothetical protein|nr:hypothetical protein [Microcoleus sp. FACHB-53]
MARAIERIEQDLAALEEATALLRAELHKTYSQYLQLLGQAVRRQLILASYQVCTHGYPEAFLSLSFNQRQKLQQSIQQMGKKAQEQLLSHLEASKKVTKAEVTDSNEPVPQPELTNSEPPQDVTPEPLSIVEQVPGNLEAPETINITNPELTKPEQLAQWQEELEEAIGQTLETLSLNTNRLLQQTGIIPRKLPAAVLEAATKADSSTESVTVGSPNLLNLLMETESEDDSEDSTLTRIIAINLRLSEIEFADPALNAGRNQIRNLSAKRNTLHREYHKKQRERSVAQAEAAWRASWFED